MALVQDTSIQTKNALKSAVNVSFQQPIHEHGPYEFNPPDFGSFCVSTEMCEVRRITWIA